MMDAMSEIKCPDEFTIKRILLDDLIAHFNSDKNTDSFKQVIDQMFEKFGGLQMIGSMAGWHIFSRPNLIKMCIEHVEKEQNSLKFVTIETNTNAL